MKKRYLIFSAILILTLGSYFLAGKINERGTWFQVLNHHTPLTVGEEWSVHFLANGKGRLIVENLNPEEVRFKGLYYYHLPSQSYKKIKVRKRGNRVIANWIYDTGKIVYSPSRGGKHRLSFIFGRIKDWATNSASTTEVVSTESGSDSDKPSLAVDATHVYIAWGDKEDYDGDGVPDEDIVYKRKPIGGNWLPGTAEVVSTESTLDSSHPSLVVDSTHVYIAWLDLTDYMGAGGDPDIFYKKKPITGSWPTGPGATEVVSTESGQMSIAPSIAVDSRNVYIAWQDDTNWDLEDDPDIFYKKKLITGSWPIGPGATEVVSTESTLSSFHPQLAVDSSNVYIAWLDYTPLDPGTTDKDLFYKKKPIPGNWPTGPGATELVSTESRAHIGFPQLAIDSKNVYVAWLDKTDYEGTGTTDHDIVYKRKPKNGNWSDYATELVSIESTEDVNNTSLAVDSSNVYIAWSDKTDYDHDGIPDADIIYKKNPIGENWPTEPGDVEVVSTKSDGDSEWLSLAVEPKNVHIAWQDKTDYNYSDSDWDIFYRSFSLPSPAPAAGTEGSCSACLIATVVYTDRHGLKSRISTDKQITDHRSPVTDNPITTLCRFRDEYLLTNPLGKAFVRFYYKHSPRVADFIRDKEILKAVVRWELKPLLWLVGKTY